MSKVPEDLLYTEDDEWLRVNGEEAEVGITDHAQDLLSDIVYLELPADGGKFDAGETFGVVESVKAAADLYMPVSGEVVAVNEDLMDTPEHINEDPYGKGWMIRIALSDPGELENLYDPNAYEKHVEEAS